MPLSKELEKLIKPEYEPYRYFFGIFDVLPTDAELWVVSAIVASSDPRSSEHLRVLSSIRRNTVGGEGFNWGEYVVEGFGGFGRMRAARDWVRTERKRPGERERLLNEAKELLEGVTAPKKIVRAVLRFLYNYPELRSLASLSEDFGIIHGVDKKSIPIIHKAIS